MVEGRQPVVLSLAGAIVHEGLHSLLVAAAHLHLVQGRVNHLSVNALELAVAAKIDLDVLVLAQQLTNKLQHAQQGLVEGLLFHLSLFGHHGEVGLDHRAKGDLGLLLIFSHLGVVVKSILLHEVVVHFDIGDALVIHKGLESNGTEIG